MDEPKETTTDFEAAYKAGMVAAKPKSIKAKDRYAIVPAGAKLASLERYLPNPLSKISEIELNTPEDFISYLDKHSTESTLILQGKPPKDENYPSGFPFFRAVLDYHESGMYGDPGWGDHIATLKLPPSAELIAWMEREKDQFTQIELAEFIEDHFSDFLDPSAGDMLSVATKFQTNTKNFFSSAHRLEDGSYDLQISSEVTAKGGGMKVPSVFKIRIPLYEDAELTEMLCRFRFRTGQDGLGFVYSFIEPGRVFREMRNNLQEHLEDELKTSILRGIQLRPQVYHA